MSSLHGRSRDGPELVPDARSELPEQQVQGTEEQEAKPKRRRPGPNGCRKYLRGRVADALPEIADTLIAKAIAGALAELKVLVQLSGLDEKKPAKEASRPRGRTIEEKLMEDWRKEPLD